MHYNHCVSRFVCLSNLLSKHSFWHRILIYLRFHNASCTLQSVVRSKAVVLLLLLLLLLLTFCLLLLPLWESVIVLFCCTLIYVHSSIAIILRGKRELVALLNLSSWCLVMVERVFLAVP